MSKPRAGVEDHYDAVAPQYHQHYERESLRDLERIYPANYFRLQMLLNAFVSRGLKRVIEVGVGEGTPIATLAGAGFDVWGFDISREMVSRSQAKMREAGLNEAQIFWGDVEDPITYSHVLRDGQFDGLVAMGVMPHVKNDDMVLRNMATMVRPGGSVFVEFRNKMFSLFTFNRYTLEFILDDLLRDVGPEMKEIVRKDLSARLRVDMPPVRATVAGQSAPGYDAILSRFHNPFEVVQAFERAGFRDVKHHFYHYHPAMPYLADSAPGTFREEAIRLEHESSNWRGFFLCSAFVIEAVKAER